MARFFMRVHTKHKRLYYTAPCLKMSCPNLVIVRRDSWCSALLWITHPDSVEYTFAKIA